MVNDIFFEKMLPVVACVDGKVILLAPLFDGQTMGFGSANRESIPEDVSDEVFALRS